MRITDTDVLMGQTGLTEDEATTRMALAYIDYLSKQDGEIGEVRRDLATATANGPADEFTELGLIFALCDALVAEAADRQARIQREVRDSARYLTGLAVEISARVNDLHPDSVSDGAPSTDMVQKLMRLGTEFAVPSEVRAW